MARLFHGGNAEPTSTNSEILFAGWISKRSMQQVAEAIGSGIASHVRISVQPEICGKGEWLRMATSYRGWSMAQAFRCLLVAIGRGHD